MTIKTGLDEWPDISEIVYFDHYGNAITGLRHRRSTTACASCERPAIGSSEHLLSGACRAAFWYRNSMGLVEIAVNRGR